MTKYADASRDVSRNNSGGGSPVPMGPSGACSVPGCQLPAVATHSTTGANDWYCRLHFNCDYDSRGSITAKANNRIGAYRLALRCMNAPLGAPVPDKVVALLKQLGRKDLHDKAKPLREDGPLTARRLGMHMLNVLDKECRDGAATAAPAQNPDDHETWLDAGQVAGHEVAA